MQYFSEETVEKIRRGYYSAVYFNKTKQILFEEKNFKTATMQIFQKNDNATVCGVNEVIELLKVGVGYFEGGNWISKSDEIEVRSLKDGDKANAWETVMHISGPYVYFAHLESIYLGILARRTRIATNTRRCVEAANGKPVVFFADRFDYFSNQEGDGFAAHVGGAASVCTQAQAEWWNGEAAGTIPHALIALNSGNTVLATEQFAKHIKGVKVVALVDFDNNCVQTSLEVARKLKNTLWGVRLDTAENVMDASFEMQNAKGKRQKLNSKLKSYYGVNPELVKLVRKALDSEGFRKVKIVVSGGFSPEKIKWFESEKTPVDVYGVGSAIIHGNFDYTADVVGVEGKPIAKAGREYKENSRLTKF